MLTILCEDSEMGKSFWNKINYYCLDNKAKVVSAGAGVGSMIKKLETLSLGRNDYLLFAIDNVGNVKRVSENGDIKVDSVKNILDLLEIDKMKRGYKCKVTEYFCIEEVFLAFDEFAEWLQIPQDVKYSFYLPIYNFIRGKTEQNYFQIEKYRNLYPDCRNREQLADSILNNLSHTYRKGFWIHKGRYSECWYSSCINGEGVPYKCIEKENRAECYLHMKGYNFSEKEKLEFFWKFNYLDEKVMPIIKLREVC